MQMNPGIAKGYALDFAAPLRYVAEALDAREQTLDQLVEGYEHDAEELDRVWDHELRKPGQRRSAKPDVQEERRVEAKRWLLGAAVAALGTQVREGRNGLVLAVPLAEVEVQGLPVAFDPARVEARPRLARATSRPRTRQDEADGRKPAAHPVEPEAPASSEEPSNPFREWFDQHGYTVRALARALGVEPRQVEAYRDGSQQAPRVVLLALWAIDRGAEL